MIRQLLVFQTRALLRLVVEGYRSNAAFAPRIARNQLFLGLAKRYPQEQKLMANSSLVSGFWITGLILNCGLVAVLIGKGSLRRFPLFGAYSIFALAGSVAMYLLHEFHAPYLLYFYTYWIREGIAVLLGLAVVYEIFKNLFIPYPALRRLAKLVFQWAVMVLVLMGLVVVYAQSATTQSSLARVVMVIEEATRIIEVGLLMFLFLFSTAFGLHWRQYVFGIALGLGIFTTVELVGVTMRIYWGAAADHIFAMVRTIAFTLSLMLWVGYLLVPELETVETEVPHRGQLEQWNRALTEFIYQ